MIRTITPAVKNLLIINIIVFVISMVGIVNQGTLFEIFGMHYVGSEYFKVFQLFTYMFFHADFRHIFGNMFGLLIFGPMLEQVWGAKRFVIFYLVCGVGAGIIYAVVRYLEIHPIELAAINFIQNPTPEGLEAFYSKYAQEFYFMVADLVKLYTDAPQNQEYQAAASSAVKQLIDSIVSSPMVGASGALFGIMAAMALLFPNTEVYVMFIPIPLKVMYVVGFYAIYELFMGINPVPGDKIAHYAHLGGMLVAFVIITIWKKDKSRFY